MMKLALLDDYHGVATRMADWGRLADRVEVASFDAKIADVDELVRRLAPFDAILAMCEWTAFPRPVLERLPNLRLLITTGMWNAAIDVDAATELGACRSAARGTSVTSPPS
jgi:phosphoglycerate dehydrogenase-like enzyme